jgi:hypothetical protein
MRNGWKQQGMTFISMLILLVIGGFFVLLAFKLGPIYIENYQVKSALASLKNEPGAAGKSPQELRILIDRKLYINEVRSFDPKQFKVKNVDGKKTVEIKYEVREPILGNVDALVKFFEKVEL